MKDDDEKARIIPFPRPSAKGSGAGPNGTSGDGGGDEHDYASPLLTLKKRSTFIRSAMLALPRWITPNGVTIFRALLIVPIAVLLAAGSVWAGLGVIAVAILLGSAARARADDRAHTHPSGGLTDPP